MENPFLFGSAASDKWFTDRKDDTQRLKANFTHGINTIIISPRRWGKTSLVLKVANEINEKNIIAVNIDIFACRSPEDFYQVFAREIIRQTSNKWEEWVANTKKFLSNLTPKISFGSDPNAEFSLSIDLKNTQLNEEVLSLPQKIAQDKGVKIVVCIDEFQQIADFSDSLTFQKKLRSVWQLQSQSVSYCLYGSKKHLLNTLFSKQSSPFYKFGDVVFLQKISEENWVQYICGRFSQTGKHISEDLAAEICRTVEYHSSYVQQFAWIVWVKTEHTATETNVKDALDDMINQNAMLYYNYIEGLTSLQINFIRAIADGVHDGFSQQEILSKYHLGVSSNISRIKKSLENKELIDISKKLITFNDPVFRLWFSKEM